MVRSAQSTTFSSSAYFADRGAHGTAQPITERINVSERTVKLFAFLNRIILATFPAYRFILLS